MTKIKCNKVFTTELGIGNNKKTSGHSVSWENYQDNNIISIIKIIDIIMISLNSNTGTKIVKTWWKYITDACFWAVNCTIITVFMIISCCWYYDTETSVQFWLSWYFNFTMNDTIVILPNSRCELFPFSNSLMLMKFLQSVTILAAAMLANHSPRTCM